MTVERRSICPFKKREPVRLGHVSLFDVLASIQFLSNSTALLIIPNGQFEFSCLARAVCRFENKYKWF